MKKLIAAIAMVGAVATASFALTFKASAGFAYGYSNIFDTQKQSLNIGPFSIAESNYKTETKNNSLGFKLQGTLGLTNNLGITLESSFLFPINGTAFKYTNLDNGKTYEDTTNYDGSFICNLLIGPTYTFNPKSKFTFDATVGFDIGVNNYSTKISDSSTSTKSYALIGIGAKADAQLLVTKHAGLKFGLTFAYLWGNQYINVVTSSSGSDTTTKPFEANGFYLIPDVSLVYKF